MIKTFINAFKIKEVRTKLFFTFCMLVVIRIGSQLPIPGVDRGLFNEWYSNLSSQSGGAMGFLDQFTGGSFSNFSIFALSITPYITSSIIMQLLTIAIPKLEEMNKDEDGRKKIASITRYVTVALSLIEGTAMAVGFRSSLDTSNGKVLSMIAVVAALTAGSAFLMWVGEQITEHGVGNGISIVLLINIVSRMPADIYGLFQTFVLTADNVGKAVVAALIIMAVIVITVILVIILNDGVRKIPVQYAKKVQGNRMVGGNNSHIPLRVNTAGVMPIIFASSILQFPLVITSMLGKQGATGIAGTILRCMSSDNWFKQGDEFKYTIGFVVYIVLVIFFAYFYTSLTFNPLMISDNMKKSGGFIPGIRPGKPTTEYLNNVLNYIIFMGAVGLIIVAVIPIFFSGWFGADVSFGGTSLIIVVSVLIDTLKQIETMMLERNYKGFLNA